MYVLKPIGIKKAKVSIGFFIPKFIGLKGLVSVFQISL